MMFCGRSFQVVSLFLRSLCQHDSSLWLGFLLYVFDCFKFLGTFCDFLVLVFCTEPFSVFCHGFPWMTLIIKLIEFQSI